jgi:hypothetical protein
MGEVVVDKNKKMFGIFLALFVLAGLGMWAWRNFGTPKPQTAESVASVPENAKVVVYYFRTNYRCMTCKKFEAYTKAELESDFAREMKDGSLVFQMVNVEESGNEHFVQDYGLKTKSLVLVEPGGKKRWKNLDKIWAEVASEPGYKHYIQTEIKAFLAGAS